MDTQALMKYIEKKIPYFEKLKGREKIIFQSEKVKKVDVVTQIQKQTF